MIDATFVSNFKQQSTGVADGLQQDPSLTRSSPRPSIRRHRNQPRPRTFQTLKLSHSPILATIGRPVETSGLPIQPEPGENLCNFRQVTRSRRNVAGLQCRLCLSQPRSLSYAAFQFLLKPLQGSGVSKCKCKHWKSPGECIGRRGGLPPRLQQNIGA